MATIRKRGSRWQVQVRRIGHPPLSKSFLQRSDAETWGRLKEVEIERGELPIDRKLLRSLTLGDLMRRYCEEITPTKRGAVVERIRINSLLARPIARLTLDRLTPRAFAEHRDERLGEVSGPTVRRELAIIQHCLEVARVEWGTPMTTNPMALVAKPRPGLGRCRRLTEVEANGLARSLAATRNPIVKEVFLFGLATGMRRGEILGLRWEHVNLAKRTAYLSETKNGTPRDVPLSSSAMEVLTRRQQVFSSQDDLVFPISPNAFRLAWERLKRRANVQDLRFHDLRHEAISRFFELGLSLPEVKLISGHKDPRMLLRYTHLKAEEIAGKLFEV